MNQSTVKSSVLSVLAAPPQQFDERTMLRLVLILTGLLVVAVPLVAVMSPIPLLALVAVAALVYAAILVATNTVFEGLCGAVFVLCTFSGNLPLLERASAAGPIQLNLLLVDFVVIPLVGLFVYWNRGFSLPTIHHLDTMVGYALGGVVVWSLLAALVGNGQSRFAAIVFVIKQARYLLVFAVVVGVVRYTGFRTALYSLLVALGGQMAYAIAEVFNRGSFGLNYLGDSPGVTLGTFDIGPVAVQTSMYAGGFVGTARGLVLLIILFSPIVIERIVNGTRLQRSLSVAYLLGGAFMVRVSATDSGWIAFFSAMLLVVIALAYSAMKADTTSASAETIRYLYGYACTLGVAVLVLFSSVGLRPLTWFSDSGREQSDEGPIGANDTGGASNVTSTPSTGATPADSPPGLVEQIPLVDTANLGVRVQQYVAASEIGLTYPLFGLGGDNFPLVAESYGLPKPIAVHNVYFAHLANIGILGGLLFIVAFVLPAVVALRQFRRSGNDRLLWGMLVCGLLGFYAYNGWTTGYTIAATSLSFWALAGAIVAESRYRSDDRAMGSSANTATA